MLLPMIGLATIIYLLVEESPNYHLSKKHDKEACIDSLTTIAVYNGKTGSEIAEIAPIINQVATTTEDKGNN